MKKIKQWIKKSIVQENDGILYSVIEGNCKICHQFPCKHINMNRKNWNIKKK